MSKAFTKDDANAPVLVPARAPLPASATNYVTPAGFAELDKELRALQTERGRLENATSGPDARDALAVVVGRLAELESRIGSAVVVDPKAQPHDEVRFGATVTIVSSASGGEGRRQRSVRIVGVDEADAARGRVAFVAPIARALLGKRVGDSVVVKTPRGEDEVEVTGIAYEEARNEE